MYTVIIKNDSGSDKTIGDLGITIVDATQITFSDQFTYTQLAGSDDLRFLVNAGDLVVNDGVDDLSSSDGENYLIIIHKTYLETNYWTKTDLSATSGSNDKVDWTQISSIPNNLASQNTLDGAYDEGGSGVGRTINADSGAVKIDATATTAAPLEIVPQSSLPITGLSNGQISIKDGIFFIYDDTRTKFVSSDRKLLTFGRAGNTKNQYLNLGVGALPSNNAGFRMIRPAVITGLSGQLDATSNCLITIRKNKVDTNIATLAIATALGDQKSTLNIDLNTGDYIQGYLESSNKVADPVVTVEIAWRD